MLPHVSLDTKENDVWVLCENTPVLVSARGLRPANDLEALARAILNGEGIVPSEIIGEDQRFVDARLPDPEAPEDAVPTIPEDEEVSPADIPIPTVFDDDEPIDEDGRGTSSP